MMGAAKRYRELVTHLKADRSRLCKAQVMGIGRLTTADQTRLCGDELQVGFVAQSLGLGDREFAFVDLLPIERDKGGSRRGE